MHLSNATDGVRAVGFKGVSSAKAKNGSQAKLLDSRFPLKIRLLARIIARHRRAAIHTFKTAFVPAVYWVSRGG